MRGIWKCKPRTVPRCTDSESLSCTKFQSMPSLASAAVLWVSEKQPRLSSNLGGVRTLTSGIFVSVQITREEGAFLITGRFRKLDR